MLHFKKNALLFKCGLILWIVWVLLNYFAHHSSYVYAAFHPPYIKTLFILIFISIGIFFLWIKKARFKLRGWNIYVFLLIALMIIYNSYVNKAAIHNGTVFKHQALFLANNVTLHIGTLFIFLCCYVAGRRLLKTFNRTLNIHHQFIIGVALGMALFTLLAMGLAALGFLKVQTLLPVILLLLLWQRKAVWSFVKYIFWNPLHTKGVSIWTFSIVAIVLMFTAFNLIGALKVFPLGFDGAALYQNLTKNLINSQHLIQGGQAYNWSLFTSVAPTLFGSMVFSIFLSHSMGILCIWGMFHLGRFFLSPATTWKSIAIFYTLPAITFHNFVDEKVDLGFLFICITIVIFFLNYAKTFHYNFSIKNKTSIRFFSLLGFLLGFALGIKYLGILLIIAIILMIIYQWGGIKAYFGMMLTTIAILFLLKINIYGYLDISSTQRFTIIGIFSLLGIGLLLFYFKKFDWVRGFRLAENIGIMLVVTLLSFMPWIIKNTIETGSISTKSILYGETAQEPLKHEYSFLTENNIPNKISKQHKEGIIGYLGEAQVSGFDNEDFINQFERLKNLKKSARKKIPKNKFNTGKREEILRYLGYETGLNSYLSLPYDISMGVNIPNKRGVNIGFLFLLFLPLLILSFKKKKTSFLKNSIGVFIFIAIFLLSWKTALHSKNITPEVTTYLDTFYPTTSNGFFDITKDIFTSFLKAQNSVSELILPLFSIFSEIAFPMILLSLVALFMLFSWIAKDNWRILSPPLKSLLLFIVTYGFLWWILGNGIPYYALIIWSLASLLIAYYYENIALFISKGSDTFTKRSIQIIFSVFVTLNVLVHFSNANNDLDQISNVFFEPFISHYSNNFITNQNFNDPRSIISPAAEVLNYDTSTKIYRVGTFMNYHIKDDITRVYEDNQLNVFDQVSSQLYNQDDFLTVLKLNGVKHIVFSLKVASIDQTPEKSLIDKANRIVKILNNKEKIRLIMTDNKVRRTDPKTNKTEVAYGLVGQTVEQGNIAIFEIL